MIQIPISDEPVTGFKRVARLDSFSIQEDLEMIINVRIIKMAPDGVTPLTELIKGQEGISDSLRGTLLKNYQDLIIGRTTRGAWVDPATGAIFSEPAEGRLSQLQYFQAITLEALASQGMPVSEQTTVSSLLYALIQDEILNATNRGDI